MQRWRELCRGNSCDPGILVRKLTVDVKTAIQNGEADALRRLLAEDSSRANALVRWGKNDCILTHPLHYVSDMLFENVLQRGKELPLIEALVQAGADLDFQRDGKGDTPLIGAASLGAEEVGLKLTDAGARPELRGLFRRDCSPLGRAAR